MLDLLDDLEIEQASLLGYLSGSAYAMSTAAVLGDRIQALMLVAGRAPSVYDSTGNQPLAVLSRKLIQQPWLLSTFFNILRNRANPDTNRNILLKIYGSVAADRAFLAENPHALDHMVATSLESLTVSAAGVAGELTCFANPTPVDVAKITCPVEIWHGDLDVITRADALIELLQDADVTVKRFPEWGSMMLYAFWEDILQRIAEVHPR